VITTVTSWPLAASLAFAAMAQPPEFRFDARPQPDKASKAIMIAAARSGLRVGPIDVTVASAVGRGLIPLDSARAWASRSPRELMDASTADFADSA